MVTVTPYIPEYITVHLGAPTSDAQNVTVTFLDYIKNVASSEVYPTWEQSALRANIYAQISFALNRVYTEFYPSRGYNFNITNSTAVDQKFIYGRNIFENVAAIVDTIFNSYIRRIGNIEPLAAKYCNGTTSTCNGLSQWGSQELAKQGYNSIEILKYYYGDDIEIVSDVPVRTLRPSYPGYPLSRGSSGSSVRVLQTAINRISQDYPAIGKINPVDGIFGSNTEEAVRAFQSIFSLTPDGVVGEATWYKMISLYAGILRLAELNSRGNQLFGLSFEYPDAIAFGDEGEKVLVTQYLLNVVSSYYPTVPPTDFDGVFGKSTLESVKAAQELFNLPQTGVVDAVTWDALYGAFEGIRLSSASIREDFGVTTLPWGGVVLEEGSRGDDVRALQMYLNTIGGEYRRIPTVAEMGLYGRRTNDAVSEFQKLFDLPVTGKTDLVTWDAVTNAYRDVSAATNVLSEQWSGETLKLGDIDND